MRAFMFTWSEAGFGVPWAIVAAPNAAAALGYLQNALGFSSDVSGINLVKLTSPEYYNGMASTLLKPRIITGFSGKFKAQSAV